MKSIWICMVTVSCAQFCMAQGSSPVSRLDIDYNKSFAGFDLVDFTGKEVMIIAEDVHNRAEMPKAVLKFFQFLYNKHGVRTFVIEGGASTAFLINQYLARQDSSLLREIVRHTFFWGVEHQEFLQKLAQWNHYLPDEGKVNIQGADIELKQESVILAINILMDKHKIPPSLSVLAEFRNIFSEKEKHRSLYDALNVYYYYDKNRCHKAVTSALADFEKNSAAYESFFSADYELVRRMLTDLKTQYEFDYKADLKFKFRDEIIYQKLVDLKRVGINNFIYLVGAKHTRPGASAYNLGRLATSPYNNKVLLINITGKRSNGKYEGARDVTKVSTQYPDAFQSGNCVLIKNDGRSPELTQIPDYTIAFGTARHITAFRKTFKGK